MCGIIGSIAIDKKFNNTGRVLEQFDYQRNRGLLGFGLVAVDMASKRLEYTTSKREHEIRTKLEEFGESDFLLFHHRIPTSTPNHVDANHPIKIENWDKLDFKYFLVHNGHITNTDELRKEHEKDGWKYTTDVKFSWSSSANLVYTNHTDSESLGIELAKIIEGKEKEYKPLGGVACLMLQVDKNNRPVNFYHFRNASNPLNYFTNQSGMFFSSEGKGEKTKEGVLYKIDLSSFKTKRTKILKDESTKFWNNHNRRGNFNWDNDDIEHGFHEECQDYCDSYGRNNIHCKRHNSNIVIVERKDSLDRFMEKIQDQNLKKEVDIISDKMVKFNAEIDELKLERKHLEESGGALGEIALMTSDIVFKEKELGELQEEFYNLQEING